MRNIEKALTDYVNHKKNKCSYSMVEEKAKKNSNAVIDILFCVINKKIDEVRGTETLERVIILLKYIDTIVMTQDSVNRSIVSRKLLKLNEKITRIQGENEKKFINIKVANRELERIRTEAEKIADHTSHQETNQYDLLACMINEMRDFNYIECVFSKEPKLINARDMEKRSLFQNTILRYIQGVYDGNLEDQSYYKDLIFFMLSQKNLYLSDTEIRTIQDSIYKHINKLSYSKKQKKKNAEAISTLYDIIEEMKNIGEKKASNIITLANRSNISIFFHESLLEESHLVRTPKTGKSTGRKFLNKYMITIDGSDAQEIDDALACWKRKNGNYILVMSASSVLGYFPYESQIVQEALGRGKTIYLPKRVQMIENWDKAIPMFPPEFSTIKGSLLEGRKRLARSYWFEIDPSGDIVETRFLKTIIQVNKRCTYHEINQVLKNGSSDRRLEDLVQNLAEVTNLMEKKFKLEDSPKKTKGIPNDFSLPEEKVGAEKIVYLSTILTGSTVADFFAENGFPCVYRVHHIKEDSLRKLQEVVNSITTTYGNEDVTRLYQLVEGMYPKGWYAMEGNHMGLGLDHYCRCCSELRSAPDIMVEHGLEVCYDQDPTDDEIRMLEEDFQRRIPEINEKEKQIDRFEKSLKRTYARKR